MITIRRYANVAEAGFAKSLLISEGIDAFLADEEAGALGPQFVPWGMRLQVREEDEQRANKILAEKENETKGTSVPPAAPAKENPPIKCPNCGAEWALTDEEMARPTFTCPDCGTAIPHEAEVSHFEKPPTFDWGAFLPRSESKWVFILVMVAYSHALVLLALDILYRFTGSGNYLDYVTGWGRVLYYIATWLFLNPIWETFLMVGIIELLRRIRTSAWLQVGLATVPICVFEGLIFWPHGVATIPRFIIAGYSYLWWRRRQSWKVALIVVILMHSLYNCYSAAWLFCHQVERDRSSLQATGHAYQWDHADQLYMQSGDQLRKGRYTDAIASLQQAIHLYPYDGRYHVALGYALQMENRHADADIEYRTGTELNPSDTTGWVDLATNLNAEKRFSEALDACHRGLAAADPEDRKFLNGMILMLTPKVTGTYR